MKNWADKVNGYGVYFRVITPILSLFIAIIGYFICMLIDDVKLELGSIKADAKIAATGMINHLEHHRALEVELAKEMSCIKTMLMHMTSNKE